MSAHRMIPRGIVGVVAVGALVLSASSQSQMPPGHPSVGTPGGEDSAPTDHPEAIAEDVATPLAIVGAFYDSISGPKGEDRDWDRFRSLFLPGALLVTARGTSENTMALSMSPDEYIDQNKTYFVGGGYFEHGIHEVVETFGSSSQVFSTYASRRAELDAEPYSRGINSFQLLHADQRWWIISLVWDREVPDTKPLPAEYLPSGDSE